MRFFHLSDLHIGLKLYNRDLYSDQKYAFDQIADYAKKYKPDALIIAGDIFDRAVPSAEAVTFFDSFLADLSLSSTNTVIMIISGNHDSAPRINMYRAFLTKNNIYTIGMPPVNEDEHIANVVFKDQYGNVNFYLLPFVNPSTVKNIVGTGEDGKNLSYNDALHTLIERENIDTESRNVLVSHQFYIPKNSENIERMDSEIVTVGNVDSVNSDILDKFDYAALGHIHKPMKVLDEYHRYCGTPLQYSVSEAGQDKGIIMVDLLDKGNIKTEVLPIKPLHSVRVIKGELDDVVGQASDDYVSVILTDKKETNAIDMQDRLRRAFPNLLEIRRENDRSSFYNSKLKPSEELNPFELCCSFLKNDLDDDEMDLLRDVINCVTGGDY